MVQTKARLSTLVAVLEGAPATLDPVVVGRLELDLHGHTVGCTELTTGMTFDRF